MLRCTGCSKNYAPYDPSVLEKRSRSFSVFRRSGGGGDDGGRHSEVVAVNSGWSRSGVVTTALRVRAKSRFRHVVGTRRPMTAS